MSLEKQVSVRFDEETRIRIHAAAEREHLKDSDIVRRATMNYLDELESGARAMRDKPLTEAQRLGLAAEPVADRELREQREISYRRERKRGSGTNRPVIGGNLGKALDESGGSQSKEGGSSHRH